MKRVECLLLATWTRMHCSGEGNASMLSEVIESCSR